MLIVVKGAGDLATGIACRLFRAGCSVVMTETAQPTPVRCTVGVSQAVYPEAAGVAGSTARLGESPQEALDCVRSGKVAVLGDPEGACVPALKPDGVVDAILAKKNLGTSIGEAPAVVGVGPGFTPGVDCHAAGAPQRGHALGRVLWDRSPAPNTGVPGDIGGYTIERLLRAPAEGSFVPLAAIGDTVEAGQTVGRVGDAPMKAQITGVVRGLLPEGTPVFAGMKAGDVDPRCRREHCFSVSDKARAVGGGVLEALMCQWSKGGEVQWHRTSN